MKTILSKFFFSLFRLNLCFVAAWKKARKEYANIGQVIENEGQIPLIHLNTQSSETVYDMFGLFHLKGLEKGEYESYQYSKLPFKYLQIATCLKLKSESKKR